MADFSLDAVQEALRSLLLPVVVATTGSTELSVHADGYFERAAGDFLADGFRRGMEVVPNAAFADETPGVISHVDATRMVVSPARDAADAAAPARSLVAPLPLTRVWEDEPARDENGDVLENGPVVQRPWIEDECVPGTNSQLAFRGESGKRTLIEHEGLYFIRVNGPSGFGRSGIRRTAEAIAGVFPPSEVTMSDGRKLRFRGRPNSSSVGQILRRSGGWSVCSVTVWWSCATRDQLA